MAIKREPVERRGKGLGLAALAVILLLGNAIMLLSSSPKAAAAGSGYLMADNFNGTLGQWDNTNTASLAGGQLIVSDNTGYASMSSKSGTGWTDYTLDVDVTSITNAASIVFRRQDDNNGYLWQLTNTSLRGLKKVNGAFAVLKEVNESSFFYQSLSSPFHLRIEAIGPVFKTYVNGILIDTTFDSTFGSGGIGFRESVSETASFDNLLVQGAASPLLTDSFGGGLGSWTNTTNATLSGGELTLTNNETMRSLAGADWTDYTLDVDTKLAGGPAGIVFRGQDNDNFYMWSIANGYLVPHKKVDGNWTILKTVPYRLLPNITYHVTIEAVGPTVRTYIDGALIDTTTDLTFTGGKVGFREYGAESAVFDNLSVVTTQPLYEEVFDNGLDMWTNTANASIVGGQLAVAASGAPRSVLGKEWADFALDVDARFTSAAAGIAFRSLDGNNAYLWQLTNGALVLKKRTGGTSATLKTVPCALAANTVYHVRIEAFGPTIRTYIDGRLIDTTVDRAFGTGTVGFREEAGQTATFDNLTVTALPLPANDRIKVMALGDSITAGASSDQYATLGGYRNKLWQRAQADGKDLDFVGSFSSGPASLPDKDAEGHAGWRSDQLAASIDGWMDTYRPDLVLLQIGTNNIGQDWSVDDTIASLGSLIDRICLKLPPSGKLYIATITPVDPLETTRGGANFASLVNAYNGKIPALVSAKASAGNPVHLADIHSAITVGDLSDGVHPNMTGYNKMGDYWYDTVKDDLISIPGFSPVRGSWSHSAGAYSEAGANGGTATYLSPSTARPESFKDVIVEADLRITDAHGSSGNFGGINIRKASPDSLPYADGYLIYLRANGSMELAKQGTVVASFNTGLNPAAAAVAVKVRASGASIKGYANGTQVIAYTDPSPLTGGYVGLATVNAAVAFSDVSVVPDLSFNGGSWTASDGTYAENTPGGYNGAAAVYAAEVYDTLTLQADLRITSDNGNAGNWAGINFRRSNPALPPWSDGYLLYIRANGWMTLSSPSTASVATINTNLQPAAAAVKVKIVAEGSRIRVYLNGSYAPAMDVTDTSVTSGGYWGFATCFASASFGNVQLF